MIEKDATSARLGILGGTFDPVHVGHVDLACGAAGALDLDSILFIPNANPPHKRGGEITPYEHRVRMLAITLDDCELCELCEVEARTSAPNYTVDTVTGLRKLYGKGTEFFLLLGSDEIQNLAGWKKPRKLIEAVNVVAISRAGSDIAQIERFGYSASTASDDYCPSPLEKRAIAGCAIRYASSPVFFFSGNVQLFGDTA